MTLSLLEITSLYLITTVIALGISLTTGINEGRISLKSLGIFSGFSTISVILFLALIFVSLFLIKSILSIVFTRKTYSYLAHQAASLGNQLTREIFQKRIDLIRFGKSQELLNAVTSGVNQMVISLLGSTVAVASDAFSFIVICGSILIFDWQTGILLLVFFSVSSKWLSKLTNERAKTLNSMNSKLGAELNRSLLDEFAVYREIALSGTVKDRFQHTESLRFKTASIGAELAFIPSISKYFLESATLVVALLLALYQLFAYDLLHAITTFSLVLAALTRIVPNALRLQTNWLTIRSASGGATFTISLINELKKVKENSKPSQSVQLKEFIPKIVLEKVTYKYPNSDLPAVKDLSLEIEVGEFVAIVGKSGSGKSTLVDIMLGFLNPQLGFAWVSDAPANQVMKEWPGAISYVPQDIAIVDRSILENVSLAPEKHTDIKSVTNALSLAGLSDEINAMPDKLFTHVGERGVRLSGGQRQRLGIARAIYSLPKMIFLDEATSSLDATTEEIVSRNIFKGSREITTIVVAHRLSTVMSADKVFYLDSGHLLGKGTFEELRSQFPEFDKQAELSGL